MKIVTGADFYICHTPGHRSQALVVDGGRIVFSGTLDEARDVAGPVEHIDCGGGVAIPGFIDSHMHALSTAQSLTHVDLHATTSLHEAVEKIVDYAKDLPAGVWVTGGRWDANRWGEEPDRELLDRCVPDRPVALWSSDLHTLWLNGAALDAVGIDDDTPDPRGGRIVRNSRGKATGVLKEDAATIAERQIPVDPIEVRVGQLARAQRQWLAQGLTGVHDFDGAASRQAWWALAESGGLDMTVVKYLRLEEWEWATQVGWRTGERPFPRLIQGGLKLFSDGALGSHTCHMVQPFSDRAGVGYSRGLPIATRDVVTDQVRDAVRHGVSVAIHAIGDQANADVITAITEAGNVSLAMPHRIEHVQFIQDRDIPRLVEAGIVAAMQPVHCSSDLPLLDHIGEDDARRSYAWKEILEAGGQLAFGSDAPVEPTNPLHAIYAAMTRADLADPATSFEPNERISAWDAIRSHTAGSAAAAGMGGEYGTLEVGKAADIIILDVDPFEADGGSGWTGRYDSEQALIDHASAIRDGKVTMTITGGEVVHSA